MPLVPRNSHTATVAHPQPHSLGGPYPPPPPANNNRKLLIVLGAVGGVVLLCLVCGIIGAIVGGDPDEPEARPPAAATTTATAPPSARPPVETTPPAPPSATAASMVAMPNLVGENAAVAEDQLRKLGFTRIEFGSQDANDTLVIVRANWTVAKQSAKPGTNVPTDTLIVLTCTKQS